MELRKIDLNEWTLFGGGATSDTYYHKTDDSVMLKVFVTTVEKTVPIREYDLTVKVYNLGVKTPRVIEMVDVDGRIGIIYQRIKNKISCARLMGDHEELIPEVARDYVKEVKKLHNTKCDVHAFKGKKETAIDLIKGARYINDAQKANLLKFVESVPDRDTCLHCDLQMGNLIKADGEYYWIDLGDFSYGHPYFDVASVMFAADTVAHTPKTQELYHMTTPQLRKFWKCFLYEYFETKDEKELEKHVKELIPFLAVYYLYVVEVNNFMVGGEELFQSVINQVKFK